MADVVTNSISGITNISNGTAIVSVTQGGLVKTLDTYQYADTTLSGIEARLTNRFDDVAYYNTPSVIDGGEA